MISPYATSVRRRRSDGYVEVNRDDIAGTVESPFVEDGDAGRRTLVAVGWTVLGWSFSASAALTVRIHLKQYY